MLLQIVLGIIGIIIVGAFVYYAYDSIRLWIYSIMSGAHVGLSSILMMHLKRVPPREIIDVKIVAAMADVDIPTKNLESHFLSGGDIRNFVETKVMAEKAGIPVNTDDLESHFLAGGDIQKMIKAMIAADKAGIELPFNRAAAIDLAGRDVLEAVQVSVNPKVIETPLVAAVAKDGIEVKVKARVTVRANIEKLVGGAGEETIIARVGEGIVSAVGSADYHLEVTENPDIISKRVLAKGLDAGTAYTIMSIDIADIDLGKNVGAELQTERAEADKKIAEAKAEERRAMAIAFEQEMKARVQEMRAKVLEEEAKIPIAMAEALESGSVSIVDYYKMKQIVADTEMRNAIAYAQTDFVDDEEE